MWDVLLNNLPMTILMIAAIIICGADLIKAISVWKAEHKKKFKNTKEIEQEEKDGKIQEALEGIQKRLDGFDKRFDSLDNRMESAEEKLQDLTVSDMHDIKSWIVEQYHKFYTVQGWIDAFNAETIDRRYEDYKKEGGNSYIDTLIERLHTLPMDPEQERRDN